MASYQEVCLLFLTPSIMASYQEEQEVCLLFLTPSIPFLNP